MKKFIGPSLNSVAPYLVLILGFFTYFVNYEKPPNLYWDENYYLTAVEKYKKNIFFQESHPPLGKLIMYAGEKIWNPNGDMQVDFEKADFARNIPTGYSFKGVRFFPAFFGWINCVLFFFLFLTLTKSAAWSLVLSFLYAMDNALIVHSRGAMLDSTQLFGVLLALLAYFKIYKEGRFSRRWSALLGVAIMWATWTKLNGLVIILLLPLMLLYPKELKLKDRFKALMKPWGIAGISMILFSICVWGIHFSKSKHTETALNNAGWYRASPELKSIKTNPEGNPNIISNFYIEFRDYLGYINNYAKGVPRLNLCKKGENGSPFYWWPLGARTINYRWETANSGSATSYLYLVPNPVVWGLALLAVLLSIAFFTMKILFGNISMRASDEHQLIVLMTLYIAYMVSIARIDRVMYTYHYFIPLIFSFAIVGKWLPYIVSRINIKNYKYKEVTAQILLILVIASAWYFYSPLTYYKPISCEAFQKRIFPGWQMKPVQCKDFKDTSIFQPPVMNPPNRNVKASEPIALPQTPVPQQFQPRTKNSLPSNPQR